MAPRRGTRSMASPARWNRSRSFSTAGVERRGGGALFFVAPHVKVGMIGSAIGQPMNQPRVTVKSEYHGFAFVKDGVEIFDRTAREDVRSPAVASLSPPR